MLGSLKAIPEESSLFKLQSLSSFLHLPLQINDDLLLLAFEKLADLIDHPGILFAAYFSSARAETSFDMIIEAG